MKPVQVRLVGRFRLSGKVPGHHQHLLYQAIHTQTDACLFLKGQQIKNKPQAYFLSILQQGKILQTMQGGIGIPHMYWCGQEQDYNFIVLQELQCDFNKLLRKCNHKFTLKTTLMFAAQVVSILQYYHFKNFIHNHLNPKHFLIGAGDKYGKLYLADYSNSVRYRDAQTLEHITENSDKKTDPRNINIQFSSIRYHRGHSTSRKDDIISLLYVMVYFLKGQLPWSSIMSSKRSQQQKSKLILQMKQKLSPEQVFSNYPDLALLYQYTQKLSFDQKPRYTYYKNIFTERMQKQGQIDDKIYDWYLLQDSQQEDQLNVDLNFDVIPNEEEFIKHLQQEINTREKQDAGSQNKNQHQGVIQPKKKAAKTDKDCLIY